MFIIALLWTLVRAVTWTSAGDNFLCVCYVCFFLCIYLFNYSLETGASRSTSVDHIFQGSLYVGKLITDLLIIETSYFWCCCAGTVSSLLFVRCYLLLVAIGMGALGVDAMGVASMYDVFLISLRLFETVPWLASAIRFSFRFSDNIHQSQKKTSVVVFVLSGGSNGDLHRRKWGIILGLNQATFV